LSKSQSSGCLIEHGSDFPQFRQIVKPLRQRLARFIRKYLSFSKRDDIHQGLLHQFIYEYNLSRIS